MIGAHELLLIVRGQNQASAALSRVSRDIRGLQRQRDVRAQQARLINKQSQEALRLSQIENVTGTRNLAIQQARARTMNQLARTREREQALSIRLTAIDRGRANVTLQRLRLENRVLTIEEEQAAAIAKQTKEIEALTAKRAAISTRGPTGGFVPFAERGMERQAAELAQHRATTARMLAEQRVSRLRETELPVAPGTRQIAERRLAEAQMAEVMASGKIARMNEAFKALKIQITEQQKALKILEGEENRFGRRTAELTAQIDNLKYSLRSLDAREAAAKASAADLGRQMKVLQRELAIVRAREGEASAQAKILRDQLAMTTASVEELNAAVAQQKWDRIATGARAVSHIGRVMQMTGLIATAAFGYMGKAAADFSTQATRAATQARRPGDSFRATGKIATGVQQEVMKMMQEFPASAEEMSNSFYEVFSGTNIQNTKQASAMVAEFNRMAVAGATDLRTMTDAGISLWNNFGRRRLPSGQWVGDFKNMREAGDAFFAAVRYGRMDAEQFANSLSNVLPVARAAGLHFRDVADAMAVVTRQSGARATSRDATGLARLVDALRRGPMRQGLEARGVQIDIPGTDNMRPLLSIIKDIHARIPEATRDTTNFFKIIGNQQSTAQARRIFSYLIKDLDQYDRISKQVNRDHGELMASFKAMSVSPGVQWTIFTNQLKALALVIGQGVVPALLELSAPIARFARWIEGLSPGTKRAIGYFAAFASVTTLVVGSLGVFAGSLIAIGVATSRILGPIGRMIGRGGLATLASEAGAVSVEMVALRLGVVGLIAVVAPLTVHFLGLHNSLQLVAVAIGAMSILKLVSGFRMLIPSLIAATAGMRTVGAATVMTEAEMAAANAQAIALRAALMRIGAIGLITVGIEIIIHRKTIEKYWADILGKLPGGKKSYAYHLLMHWSGEDVKQSRREFEKNQKRIFAPLKPKDLIPVTAGRFAVAPGLVSEHGQPIVPLGPKEVPSWLKGGAGARPGTTDRAGLGIWTDAQFKKRIIQVAQLKAALEAAPNIDARMAASKKYHKALDVLTAHSSALQKQLISDLLGVASAGAGMTDKAFLAAYAHVQQLKKLSGDSYQAALRYEKAAAALAKNASPLQLAAAQDVGVPAISDAEVMAQVRHINQLVRIANRTRKFADIKAANAALMELQNSATSAQMSAAQTFLVNLDTTMKKGTKKIKDNANNAAQAIQQIAGTLSSTFDQMQQQNQQAFGQLFQGPVIAGGHMQFREQYGYKPTGKDYLADLRAMLSRFRQWRRVLRQLQARGAPFELIQQIQALGPDALPEARALLGMAKPEFQQYVQVFRTSQRVIAKASQRDMSGQLKHWRSLGSNIMKAILQGMDEHTAEFANYFRNLAISLFPALAKKGNIKPRPGDSPIPTKGEPKDRSHGLPRGRAPHHPQQRTPHGQRVTGGRTLQSARAVPAVTNNYNTYNSNYTYEAGEMDYSTWLRKSRSHFRNRR